MPEPLSAAGHAAHPRVRRRRPAAGCRHPEITRRCWRKRHLTRHRRALLL